MYSEKVFYLKFTDPSGSTHYSRIPYTRAQAMIIKEQADNNSDDMRLSLQCDVVHEYLVPMEYKGDMN